MFCQKYVVHKSKIYLAISYGLVREKHPRCPEDNIGKEKNLNEASCKEKCNDTPNCNYIFISKVGTCEMWETCSGEKSAGRGGKLFQQQGKPMVGSSL